MSTQAQEHPDSKLYPEATGLALDIVKVNDCERCSLYCQLIIDAQGARKRRILEIVCGMVLPIRSTSLACIGGEENSIPIY
jgi:hypothetical protein